MTSTPALDAPERPTAADWQYAADRLGLRQIGGELKGPCPLCDGTDRFHVNLSTGFVGCRGCIDGQPNGATQFAAVLAAVWPERYDRNRAALPSRRPNRPQPSRATEPPAPRTEPPLVFKTTRYARRLWSESSTELALALRKWLDARNLLHPYQSLPLAIRYHAPERLIVAALWPLADYQAAWPAPPTTPVLGVQAIAIDAEGKPRIPQGWNDNKRSFGTTADAGGVVALGPPTATAVHLCEGLADGLAIYGRCEGLVLPALTGIASLGKRIQAQAADRRCYLWPDNDEPGLASAQALASTLKRAGADCALVHCAADPAADAASLAWPEIERAEFDQRAGQHLDSGQPTSEADRLAIQSLIRSTENDDR